NECQKLPISSQTWKKLKIDEHLRDTTTSQNLTLSKYAAIHNGGNFICGIGEHCNAGQLCHPVKAPAWQVLYAVQEYNNFVNRMVDSINYSLSQVQALSASMVNDLFPEVTDSRFVVNLKWIFTDMYRGIAYGAMTLFISIWLNIELTTAIVNILLLTAVGAGLAAWIQGAPETATFTSWTALSFYIAQAQQSLTANIGQAMERSLREPLSTENGIGKILQGGAFFQKVSKDQEMGIMEESILKIFQGRLMARMLRQQNAYVIISQSDCQGLNKKDSKNGDSKLFYCDAKEKLYCSKSAQKKTVNEIHGAEAIVKKYNFTAEEITKSSWECQKKYGVFEHDSFAKINGTYPEEVTNKDCIFNLPVCDTRLDAVRELKLGKHKTTTVACRIGAKLPI
ncbi:hypothetical protein PPACK8108_LOCUS4104, partial [Phakopsora pachyrhizi]